MIDGEMRRSSEKHTLAVLRLKTGMYQNEFAALLNRSATSIQKIELGILPLSHALATEVMIQTGVHLGWLLDGDVAVPIKDRFGKPYTRETFENAQAELKRPKFEPEDVSNAHYVLAEATAQIASHVLAAYQANQLNLLGYRLRNAIGQIGKEMGLPLEPNGSPMGGLGAVLGMNFGLGPAPSKQPPLKPKLNPIFEAYGKRIEELIEGNKQKTARKKK